MLAGQQILGDLGDSRVLRLVNSAFFFIAVEPLVFRATSLFVSKSHLKSAAEETTD